MLYTRETFKEHFIARLESMHGKPLADTSDLEQYKALASLTRDIISKQWIETNRQYRLEGQKQVYYLSIEFLLGRMLGMNLINLGLYDLCAEALADLGISLGRLEEVEEDPGLGNGGLGRLAACYLDSMAAQGLPGHGCCLRYRYGFFEQRIVAGYQKEVPDDWLNEGFAWEYRRPAEAVTVKFGGNVQAVTNGKLKYIHDNYEAVSAVPYDVPIVGFKNRTVNTLRIWSAEPVREDFVCAAYNRNDCLKAAEYKYGIEMITSVLYPDDSTYEGKILRLKQQYFLVSASLQSIVRDAKRRGIRVAALGDNIAIHINDTHPAVAIPEMMRILIDEEGLGWDEAWSITVSTMSYTNHTVLPEALETWPVEIFQQLLPRIFIIINEINERFCRELWNRYPGNWDKISSMAIIADNRIRMANLAIIASHSVNGVAELHTEILKTRVMEDFNVIYPDKFNNKTNGVAHRRWLYKVNPPLAGLLHDVIGTSWLSSPCDLLRLADHADDHSLLDRLGAVKRTNKLKLANYIKDHYGLSIDPDSIFDVQIKRIHGYKRQTMNILHIMHMYNLLRSNPSLDIIPRTFIFGGKAAPGYQQAKRTIKWINAVAALVNNDPAIQGKLKVIFLENYNVSLAELIIPGSDVSEQIPAASREACGTGNMKFMMNGAVTIGTLDGANIEIRNAVGDDNIIIFGLTAAEVMNYYRYGGYNAWEIYNSDERVKTALDQLVNGFLPAGPDEFRPLFDAFLHHNDEYFVLKDFSAYAEAQKEVERRYRDQRQWLRMCLYNIAHSGKFSGDRTFAEYAADIWKLRPAAPAACYHSDGERPERLYHDYPTLPVSHQFAGI
ncbi:MAG: glycogen/starch/alpha-glucan phosphorylase [Negativicutes bacterium]|nr:glycogen/starch/alpha-glucan phosphorylase [Negativicutes bacterium]